MQPTPETAPIHTLGLKLPEWTPESVARAWEVIEAYPIVGFLVIVALSYLAAKLAEAIVDRGFRRLTAKTETDFDDRVVAILHRPIFIAVFLGGLALAVRSLRLQPTFTTPTVNVLQTLVVLVWLREAFPFFSLVLEGLSRHRDRFPLIEERTLPLFDIGAKVLLVAGGSYLVLDIWGVDPTPWLASAGVVGIAVGFAAKDTLANLFGGFFIVADAPYKIGDFIILDSGERGRVTQIGIRSTRLETRDDIEITIPNAAIANAKIINEAGGRWEKERVRIKVGVAYGSDVDRVCEVLKRVAVEQEHICGDPEPRVRFRAFGSSSLDFELLCWIDEPVLRGRLTHVLNMEVYKAFLREGIEIPFPQQDVYIRRMPGAGD
jgi:small-conductance mechanosensitive channel